ncbi:MAG: hypothetical protein IT537_28370 [Hyphomicrobiales bacterium]|nr:hypothetical protein [Hyphomicrobiales bacterium]
MSRRRGVQLPPAPQRVVAAASDMPAARAGDTLELRIERVAAIWNGGLIESTGTRAQHELTAAIEHAERTIADVMAAARRLEADADRLGRTRALVAIAAANVGAFVKHWRDRLGLHTSPPAPGDAPLIIL